MSDEIDVVIAGRPSCDVVMTGIERRPVPGHEVRAGGLVIAPGGHFNTAAALARLGVRPALVATVGHDVWGDILVREALAERLSTEWIHVRRETPTPVSVALNFDGDRAFVTYEPAWEEAARDFVARALELLATRTVRWLHADLSTGSDVLVPAAKDAGVAVSVDAHEAGEWLGDPRVHRLFEAADVVFVNEEEAKAATATDDADDALELLAGRSPHVVLKRGERGAASLVDGERHDVRPIAVETLDATGAGDCFVAGYLAGLLRGLPAGDCLELANRCGAAAVSRPGGYAGALRSDELFAATP